MIGQKLWEKGHWNRIINNTVKYIVEYSTWKRVVFRYPHGALPHRGHYIQVPSFRNATMQVHACLEYPNLERK